MAARTTATNFALTHSSCNRSKQAADFRVARILARFRRHPRQGRPAEPRAGAKLSDILDEYGGAIHELRIARKDSWSNLLSGAGTERRGEDKPIYRDELSGMDYFFTKCLSSTFTTTNGSTLGPSAAVLRVLWKSFIRNARSFTWPWRGLT